MAGIVREVNTTKGFVRHRTLIQTMQEFPDYAGYLYTNDDVVLNPYQLATYDKIKIWKHVHARPISGPTAADRPTFGTGGYPAKERCGTIPRASRLSSAHASCSSRASQDKSMRARSATLSAPGTQRVPGDGGRTGLVVIESTEELVDWNELYLWDQVTGHKCATWHGFLEPGVSMLHPVKLGQDVEAKDVIKE
ncbi:hypothetical protein BGZ82_004325 [Podila clonocystis]|nr:hypothetical protein BGZ82_004325 [Podila clonocystis]